MKPAELAQARGELVAFAAEMFASLPRSDQRRWGETYLRGLMLDGRRKSIEPMAARLADGDEQCLQQFVNQSPWEWEPVRERLAARMSEAIAPLAWIVDDTGFPKAGRYSVGVARQYSGTLGKVGNCQIGVSVSAASEAASCPLDWRLFLPAAWDDDAPRRAKAHLPEKERHRPKWQLALEMLDELRAWGLCPPPVVADAGYGEITAFRAALEERELAYVVEVKAATSAYAPEVAAEQPPWRGSGRRPAARYRQPPASLRALALAAGCRGDLRGRLARGLARHDGGALPGACACGPPTSACGAPIARRCRSPGCSASGPRGRPSRASTGSPTCRRRRRSPIWCAWPSCAGASSTTTASSRTPSASITSRGARSAAGTITSPSSRWRTASSPCSASTQKRMRRPEPVRRPARAAAADGLLDRRLPDLRTEATLRDRLSCTRRHDHT